MGLMSIKISLFPVIYGMFVSVGVLVGVSLAIAGGIATLILIVDVIFTLLRTSSGMRSKTNLAGLARMTGKN